MEDLSKYKNNYEPIPVRLGGVGYKDFFYYVDSYDNAIKILIDKINEDINNANDIKFPLLFLIRHCLEIGYKANLLHFNEFLGLEYDLGKSSDNKKGHNLENLHIQLTETMEKVNDKLKNQYNITLSEIDNKDFSEYFRAVDMIKTIYSTLDSYSMAFRYPTDLKNKKFFNDNNRLDLKLVIELYKKSILLLIHAQDVYERYFEYARETMERYSSFEQDESLRYE